MRISAPGSATQYLRSRKPSLSVKGSGGATLAYETWEAQSRPFQRDHGPTGISPSAHAASNSLDPSEGWWEPVIGPGKAIDTDSNFVICINSIGSCKGSTGPASINPATGKPYRLDFPELTIWDIAAAAQLVLDHLGIEQLRTMVGPSMGGMSGLAWLYQHPAGARHFLSVSSSAWAEPFSIAIRSLQREAIVTDPNWHDGNYTPESWPWTGMRLARKLGMITYRSEREWRKRFGRQQQSKYKPQVFGMNYKVESYLENAARKFVVQYDPCAYVYLSRAMDWFNVADGHTSLGDAVSQIELESACIIGVDSDILFPLHQQRDMAEALAANAIDAELVALPSDEGHDSFLVDYDRFKPAIASYMQKVLAMESARL
jgi:homoserine O-acetyltransferase